MEKNKSKMNLKRGDIVRINVGAHHPPIVKNGIILNKFKKNRNSSFYYYETMIDFEKCISYYQDSRFLNSNEHTLYDLEKINDFTNEATLRKILK